MTIQRWGGLASFVLAAAFVLPPVIHLFGDLRAPFGALAYDLADLLTGPVWAACLVVSVVALREQTGPQAPRRMSVALLSAGLAAAAMVAVACIRSGNRHYHLERPDLHLEGANFVLLVWATLVAGLSSVGWHFLGWTFVLVGSAGWATRRLPRALSALYLAAGFVAAVVYVNAELEPFAVLLALMVSSGQGFVLWRAAPRPSQTASIPAGPT